MHAHIYVHTTRTTGINSKAFFTILRARARSLFTPLLINHECTGGLSARNARRLPSTFTRARLFFFLLPSFFFSHKMDFRRLVNRLSNPREWRTSATRSTPPIINNFFLLFPSTWLRHLYLNRIYVGARVSLLSAHDRETTPWTFWFAWSGGEELGSPPRRNGNINLVHLLRTRRIVFRNSSTLKDANANHLNQFRRENRPSLSYRLID